MMFNGKVVLITGASSGIGAATAIHFAKLGASLSITGRNEDNLNEIALECEKVGNKKALTVIGDLNDEKIIEHILDVTMKHYNKLDVLVNNAGFGTFGSIETTSLQQYDDIFQINVRSVFYLTKLATPFLKKTRGNIVNVSSLNGLRSFRNMLAYSMSKSALDQFTRCVALELASAQVRVNSVNPGSIPTGIQRSAGLTEEELAKLPELWKVWHPLGRAGDVNEVAQAVVFLASSQSSFITGINLPVDGGRQADCPC